MSKNKTVATPKGTLLPLINMKGKDYLQVAHRLQWLNEAEARFTISSDIIGHITEQGQEQATIKSTVLIFDEQGRILKQVSATKTEHKAHFPDYLEKAETGSIGRALAMIGYGTQYALSDLDEGERIVDSPLLDVNQEKRSSNSITIPNDTTSIAVASTGPNIPQATPVNGKDRSEPLPVKPKLKTRSGWVTTK